MINNLEPRYSSASDAELEVLRVQASRLSCRSISSKLQTPDYFSSVRDFGAVYVGSTDNIVAINLALKTGFYVELPQQTCAFKGFTDANGNSHGLLFANPNSSIHGSGMWGASRLLYFESNTTIDLLMIGSSTAPTNTSGTLSLGFQAVNNLLIESSSKWLQA